jgi:DNA-binding NarL/FixJ family response regulator
MSDIIDVAVIEDQEDIREGLAVLIGSTPGFRCVGAYRSMEEALPGISRRPPAVALLDIGLPGMSGLDGIRPIRERQPTIQILMLTVYEDDDRIFNALCAGATGYLLKKTPPGRLIENVRDAMNGGSPMSPEVARKVVALFRTFRPRPDADYDLTGHETRLLRMLVDGHNYKTAAEELGVSVNTVAFHMKRVYEKLQVHSKSEAVSKALREGLIQ